MTDPRRQPARQQDRDQALVASTAERMMPLIMEGMMRLSPAERRRLDALIGPEAVFLMTKAYGPEIGALLWPLAVADGDGAGGRDTEGPGA